MKSFPVLRGVALVVLSLLLNSLALAKPPQYQGTVLKPGTYKGIAKALPCEGCATMIKDTLEKTPGLEAVSVDQKDSSVTFSVKKGTQLKLSDIQTALQKASDRMGMGADYRLDSVRRL